MPDLVEQVQEAQGRAGALLAIAASAENAAGVAASEAIEAVKSVEDDFSKAERSATLAYTKAVDKAKGVLQAARAELEAGVADKQAEASEARAALVAYQAETKERLGVNVDLSAAIVSGGHMRL